MKRIIVIILVAFLLLNGFTYAVGYGYDQLRRSGSLCQSDRQTRIVELYSKRRDGPDTSNIKSAWTEFGEQRLNKCQTEITLLWKKVLERVNAL